MTRPLAPVLAVLAATILIGAAAGLWIAMREAEGRNAHVGRFAAGFYSGF